MKCSYHNCENSHKNPRSDKAIDEGWSTLEFKLTSNKKHPDDIKLIACPEHSKYLVKMMKNKIEGNIVDENEPLPPLPDWLKVAAGVGK